MLELKCQMTVLYSTYCCQIYIWYFLYSFLLKLVGDVRGKLQWADTKAVKNEIDMQILDLLGPKTEEDMKKPAKTKVEFVVVATRNTL